MYRNADFDVELAEIGRPSGYRALIGYRTAAWSDGYSEVLLRLDLKHMNSYDIPHGGIYLSLLDAAMGHAATFCDVPDHKRSCLTVSLQTNFLAPGKGDHMRAIARLVDVNGRLATCSGEIVDAFGTQCCVGLGTFRYRRGSEHKQGVRAD